MNPAENKPTLHQQMLDALVGIDGILHSLDSLLQMCSLAVSTFDDDDAGDASIVLAAAAKRVKTAQYGLSNAFKLMPELLRVECRRD